MIWICFFIFLAACFAAGTTGSLFPPGKWYEDLEKPRWVPPNWVFPVVWTTLYLCIAAAGARLAVTEGNAIAMAFWALQIALNVLWTPMFFGLGRMRDGMIVISGLWIAVAGCMIAGFQIDPISGLLFAPYLVWVTIASALNFSVMRLNPNADASVRTA
ncbi:TspO/MBR family protein [Maritimibacter sp. UBA3975]|uniref:tryptophan-rich sensory protein TspO n=1 Tax=Maritimibacter sp. UBA3975 TaxID=1946833 RepID=UPI000C0A8706|nr:TspO/MBR family protein [Maritimibacter sp. UBA3975]MAM62934.1 sensory protein TspO [Maritimibacter sp.]|tara:strand:+ start:48296 stop:48772 length:477 start_codon:yes stop_codon:yes gene_type:complete